MIDMCAYTVDNSLNYQECNNETRPLTNTYHDLPNINS